MDWAMDSELYKKFLLQYSQTVNVISRKATEAEVDQIIRESLLLRERLETPLIIDAGSGNGILGIPLAMSEPARKYVLVESKQKKIRFLMAVKKYLKLDNVTVFHGPIQEYLKQTGKPDATLIARGFPRNDLLIELFMKKKVMELAIITSPAKIKKYTQGMEKIKKNVYNIPLRDNLVILKMEHVSRETSEKWVK